MFTQRFLLFLCVSLLSVKLSQFPEETIQLSLPLSVMFPDSTLAVTPPSTPPETTVYVAEGNQLTREDAEKATDHDGDPAEVTGNLALNVARALSQ